MIFAVNDSSLTGEIKSITDSCHSEKALPLSSLRDDELMVFLAESRSTGGNNRAACGLSCISQKYKPWSKGRLPLAAFNRLCIPSINDEDLRSGFCSGFQQPGVESLSARSDGCKFPMSKGRNYFEFKGTRFL